MFSLSFISIFLNYTTENTLSSYIYTHKHTHTYCTILPPLRPNLFLIIYVFLKSGAFLSLGFVRDNKYILPPSSLSLTLSIYLLIYLSIYLSIYSISNSFFLFLSLFFLSQLFYFSLSLTHSLYFDQLIYLPPYL